MAKKRSHERTPEERAIHERAVKLRKMTDEQLVVYIDGGGGKTSPAPPSDIGAQILEKLRGLKGIGVATLAKIEAAVWEVTRGAGDG